MSLDDILFKESPYIEFNDNPITSPLVRNWRQIRDEYLVAAQRAGNRTRHEWIREYEEDKGTFKTQEWHDFGTLYEGVIKPVPSC